MITEALLLLLLGAAEGLVGLLPVAGSLDLAEFAGAIAQFRAFNEALPAVEVIAMAGTMLAIIGGIIVVRVVLLLYDRIPGKFT